MPTLQIAGPKKAFIAQFMNMGEAKADFPDEKQRLAVAHSMYARKNSTSAEHPWPKKYTCNFIEPGIVFYQDLGECAVCKHEATCEKRLGKPCDTPGEWVLVEQAALAKMAPTFVGKPVIDMIHKDVEPSTLAKGDAEGIVTRVWFDEKTAWWMCDFIVWDPKTQEHCESLAYSVSCAYDPTEVAGAGRYHSSDYQEEVKDGMYTHLAVVTNPRYEKARITLSNSTKGGSMFDLKWWKKGERKNAAPVDPKEMINVDGKDVPLGDLVAALPDEPKKEEPKFNDETNFDTPKGSKSLGELKQAWRAKKNADDAAAAAKVVEDKENSDQCPACKGSGKKAAENASTGEEAPLPDLRDPKQNELDDIAKAKAEEDKKNADDAAAAKAEEDKKNADDAAAKLAEEKKNADDAAAAKAAEDKKNADDAAAAKDEEDRKTEERRNAGRASFKDLRNAASSRSGEPVQPIVSRDERLAVGASKYGSVK